MVGRVEVGQCLEEGLNLVTAKVEALIEAARQHSRSLTTQVDVVGWHQDGGRRCFENHAGFAIMSVLETNPLVERL
jgi:hypothetical protein